MCAAGVRDREMHPTLRLHLTLRVNYAILTAHQLKPIEALSSQSHEYDPEIRPLR
jgi:hypothetical protein